MNYNGNILKKFVNTPNIGKKLDIKLAIAGINSPEKLKRIGSKEAFLKIKTIYPDDACVNILYALEGAVQDIRWYNLEKNQKNELLEYFRSL